MPGTDTVLWTPVYVALIRGRKQIRGRLTPEKMRQRRLEKAAREALSGEQTALKTLLTDNEPTTTRLPRERTVRYAPAVVQTAIGPPTCPGGGCVQGSGVRVRPDPGVCSGIGMVPA
jgi:hypothetical protein